jgi:DNA-binding GntR family transcriptional regulator
MRPSESDPPPNARHFSRVLIESGYISRTPLREAIKLLAAEGLLELLPNRGARVAALSAVEIEELLQVIGALEGAGAELAAERVTPEELAAIEAVHEADARSLERTRLRPLFRAKP